MKPVDLKPGEKIEDLQRNGFCIISNKNKFRFGTDAVVLADFAKAKPGERVADLGAGDGILCILMSARYPGTHYDAIELQAELSDMARRSVLLNALENRITVHCMDVKDAAARLGKGVFDAVVMNPPYRKKGDGMLPQNPSLAVARFEVACTLEEMMRAASQLLKNGASLYMIYPTTRLLELLDMARDYNLGPRSVRFVHPFLDKDAKLALVHAVKNSAAALCWLPPLILYEREGVYTPQAREIYGLDEKGK